jgi:hypothetical protein
MGGGSEGSGNMMTRQQATAAFQIADDVWSAELKKAFGKNAGDVRYTAKGRGEAGTPLNAAFVKREAARKAWEAVAFGVKP